MTFILPIGLLALLALPLIVVLHLIRERRRRVVVPSVLNWRNLPRPKAGQRMTQLPLTLLLLLQLLVAGLLALAIARPQLAGSLLRHSTQTAIVLDTSTSMAARENGASRFERARVDAVSIIRSLATGDRVTLIAAGTKPRVLASGAANDHVALEAALAGVAAGGTVADLDGALAMAEAALDPALPGRIVVLTDGSANRPSDRATIAPVEWQQLGGSPANRAIIAFAARAAGGKTQVYARVANYGDAPWNGMLRLFSDDQPVDARPVAVGANSEAEQTWTLPAGGTRLDLALDGADALPDDDRAFVSLATVRPISVALVAETVEPLRRALAAVPGVSVALVPPAAYPQFAARTNVDVTVFDSFLPSAWPAGAALVIHPPQSPLLTVGQSADVAAEPLSQNGALVAGLGFGGVNFGSVRAIDAPAWADIALAAGKTPLVLRGRDGDHELAVWAFDLHESNLATRLAFPLLVARTLRDLAPAALPASIQSGGVLALRPNPRATSIELTAPDGTTQRVAGGAVVQPDTLTQSGWYTLVERTASGELFRGAVAVNAGTPLESNLRQDAPPVFSAAPIGQGNGGVRQAVDLWPWLALAALVVLAGEWLYANRRAAH